MRFKSLAILFAAALLAFPTLSTAGELANIKVVTDANPDYADMESLVRSATVNWKTDQEKMYALFYWNHIARRHTYEPMHYHGVEDTDPITQFNDFGYTNLYTIAGIQCSIWNYMGYPCRLKGPCAEVWYQGKFHAYDNSFSCMYSLADGKTIASVDDIDKPGAGPETGGKTVPNYIALYHALNATSPNGYLEGADFDRSLASRTDSFITNDYNPPFYNQERSHRYILNLREGEAYTRYYSRQDNHTPHGVVWKPLQSDYKSDPAYFVPNGLDDVGSPSDPEADVRNYRLRGNGDRTFTPILDDTHLSSSLYSSNNLQWANPGLQPSASNLPAVAVFKIEGANIITSAKIRALVCLASPDDYASIALSTTNGVQWKEIWHSARSDLGDIERNLRLVNEVNGCYDFLLKVTLFAKKQSPNAQLKFISFDTLTEINTKTQPQLHIGKNTVYVGVGEQSQSIVLDPDLHNRKYAPFLLEEKNVRLNPNDMFYHGMGILYPEKPAQEGSVIFKVDAPTDISAFTFGGRFSNRSPQSHIDLLHSFDAGKTWIKDCAYADSSSPTDAIHFERIADVPPGNRSVLLKYSLNAAPNDPDSCSLYSVHMEVNHRILAPAKAPLEVTFRWREEQKDYSFIARSHTQLVEKFPATYTINVGGEDHPVVDALTINFKPPTPDTPYGYSDGKDVGGEKWVGNWATYGNNLALHKPYTLSLPSEDWWGSGDPNLKKLTDGVVGSTYSGGGRFALAAAWNSNKNPEITLDLGELKKCAAFRIQTVGYEPWDAVKGENKDRIELLTSPDGKTYTSQGFFNCSLRWKDIPVNFMAPDDETLGGYNFVLAPPAPVETRFVKYKVTTARIFGVTEIQALDSYSLTPFDMKIALPNPSQNGHAPPKSDLSPNARKWTQAELPPVKK